MNWKKDDIRPLSTEAIFFDKSLYLESIYVIFMGVNQHTQEAEVLRAVIVEFLQFKLTGFGEQYNIVFQS